MTNECHGFALSIAVSDLSVKFYLFICLSLDPRKVIEL